MLSAELGPILHSVAVLPGADELVKVDPGCRAGPQQRYMRRRFLEIPSGRRDLRLLDRQAGDRLEELRDALETVVGLRLHALVDSRFERGIDLRIELP